MHKIMSEHHQHQQQQHRRNHHHNHKTAHPMRSELRRRKLRKNTNSSNGVKNLTSSSTYYHAGDPTISTTAGPSSSQTAAAVASSSVVPKYIERFYVHRRSSLENHSSTAVLTSFSTNSSINAFCFHLNSAPDNSRHVNINKNLAKPKKYDDFIDSWAGRKKQKIVRVQPKCGLIIQNIYFLEAISPLRQSLLSLQTEFAPPIPEVTGRHKGRSKAEKPSDADVIFGDSILYKDEMYPRWTISNLQWLMDLEAPETDRAPTFHYSESMYDDICCLPFATNLLFFKTSY